MRKIVMQIASQDWIFYMKFTKSSSTKAQYKI